MDAEELKQDGVSIKNLFNLREQLEEINTESAISAFEHFIKWVQHSGIEEGEVVKRCRVLSNGHFLDSFKSVIDCLGKELVRSDQSYLQLIILAGDLTRLKKYIQINDKKPEGDEGDEKESDGGIPNGGIFDGSESTDLNTDVLKYDVLRTPMSELPLGISKMENGRDLTIFCFAASVNQVQIMKYLNTKYPKRVEHQWNEARAIATDKFCERVLEYIKHMKVELDLPPWDAPRNGDDSNDRVTVDSNLSRRILSRLESSEEDRRKPLWIPVLDRFENQPLLRRIEELTKQLTAYVDDPTANEDDVLVNIRVELRDSYEKLKKKFSAVYHEVIKNGALSSAIMTYVEKNDDTQRFKTSTLQYKLVWQQAVLAESRQRWNTIIDNISITLSVSIGTDDESKEDNKPKLHQPITDIVNVYGQIHLTQKRLRVELYKIAHESFGEVYMGPCKGIARIAQKQAQKQFTGRSGVKRGYFGVGELSLDITDLCRGLINYSTISSLQKGIDILLDSHTLNIYKFKNGFVKCDFDSRQNQITELVVNSNKPISWQDLKVYVGFKNLTTEKLLLCEIQFCLMGFTLARKGLGGHDAYSKYRSSKEIIAKIATATHERSDCCKPFDE